jgi:hypothetical protein
MKPLLRRLPLVVLWSLAGEVRAQDAPSCASDPRFELLDPWVGTWDVYAEGQLVGHNRIEKILDGCAVTEHWMSAGGGETWKTTFDAIYRPV